MKVTLKVIGAEVVGPAEQATDSVAQEANEPMPLELPQGSTVKKLMERVKELGVPPSKISLVIVNGDNATDETPLHDGDAVTMIGQEPGM